jgi:DHA3 family macrolide efflux protein-like MFS transporter
MGLTGVGLGFLLVGLVPPPAFLFAVGGIFLAGVMNPITNGPFLSIIQASVDPGMQGRVFALVQSMATAATPLGMIIAGPVADALGVRLWYVVGGTACILMGLGSFFVPAIVHLEDDHRPSGGEARSPALLSGGRADVPQAAE